MTWLELCSQLVRPFEGCAKRVGALIYPYLDKLAKPPRWTRGYGRTYGIDESSPPITPGVAQLELETGLQAYGRRLCAMSPNLATRPECLAAVTSWAWNCGTSAYQASRLRRAINDGRWADAAELIRKPNTAGGVVLNGLKRRREAERATFLLGS
jgi:GH24 family phage-related lysozyme (muramidase)